MTADRGGDAGVATVPAGVMTGGRGIGVRARRRPGEFGRGEAGQRLRAGQIDDSTRAPTRTGGGCVRRAGFYAAATRLAGAGCPAADRLAEQGLSPPVHPEPSDEGDTAIAELVRAALGDTEPGAARA